MSGHAPGPTSALGEPPAAPRAGPRAAEAELRWLSRGLREPSIWAPLSPSGWSALVAAARRFNLLGEVAEAARTAGVQAPAQAQRHLDGVRQLALRQRLSVQWEAHALEAALRPLGVPVLLLKGAAYVMAPGALMPGRLFGDIDILVPRESLPAVESALMLAGWVGMKTNPYDQRYYRKWMHELPPMTHVHRGTVLDVHHTILPLTARNAPDPASLFDASRPVADGLEVLRIPSPEHLVIHSLTHLVHEGELHNGLRDLHDVHRLLVQFGQEPGFHERLRAQAEGNDLAGPVALGLELARDVFETPLPVHVLAALAAGTERRWRAPWLAPLTLRVMRAGNRKSAADAAAALWLFVRAHRLRMPLHLLLPHLAVKTWRAWLPEANPAPKA